MKLTTIGKAATAVAAAIGVVALAGASFALANGQQGDAPPDVAPLAAPAKTTSLDDVNAAMATAVRCMAERGIVATLEEGNRLRKSTYSFKVPPKNGDESAGPDPTIMASAQDCQRPALELDREYAEQRGVPTDAAINARLEFFEACIAEGNDPDTAMPGSIANAGYGGSDRTVTIRPEQADAAAKCAILVEEETGLYAPILAFAE